MALALIIGVGVGAKDFTKASAKSDSRESAVAKADPKAGANVDAEAAANNPGEEARTIAAYPAGTFIVMRLKSFASLEKAVESLKAWIHEHPSVESLVDEEDWKKIESLDLRAAAANALELSREKFDDYFDGAITLCASSDFSKLQTNKTVPVVMEMTTRSAQKAAEFAEMLGSDEDVLEKSAESDGVEHLKIKMKEAKPSGLGKESAFGGLRPSMRSLSHNPKIFFDSLTQGLRPVSGSVQAKGSQGTAPKNIPPLQPMDIYLTTAGSTVIVGSSWEYTAAAKKAAASPTMPMPAFLARTQTADLSVWMDPRPIFAMIKDRMEAKAREAAEKGEPVKADGAIIDNLGLSEMESLGMSVDFSEPSARMELGYAQSPSGIMKIFACVPTGLEASALIPDDADAFTLSRIDAGCLWAQLKTAAKIVVPPTEVMYEGWKKQVKDKYGVEIDQQLFGAIGDRYVMFTRGVGDEEKEIALYVAVNDAPALQASIDAVLGFFTEGKPMFDREKIGGVPVWRLKSEFQGKNAPPVAYAITPQWLIVSIGDPTQIQDLIEAADNNHETANKVFGRDEVREILANPSASGISYRPLKDIMNDVAAAAIEVQKRQMKKDSGGDDEDDDAAADEMEAPSFDDVNESVISFSESRPGLVGVTIKIVPGEK